MNIAIIGGGIVGLATAYQVRQQRPDVSVTILEKERALALHQTGRNSGVIHSGIYYLPGSAKALNCRQGRQQLLDFCQHYGVDYDLCGKVIVATDELEIQRLQTLLERGLANGVTCRLIGPEELAEIEPHAFGVQALHVPDAGIIDYRQICQVLAEHCGAEIKTGAEVLAVEQAGDTVMVESTAGSYSFDYLINCAGLHCDRVCQASGAEPGLQIVPFKGEYYKVKESASHLCRHLIYPVPDPSFPFLGVHLTRMMRGGIEVGPNAVLALGRQAYGKTDVNLGDLAQTLSYSGFLRLSARHWRMGLGEMKRSVFKSAFVKALQRLCPEITADDLVPTHSGIRAQALHPDGRLEDDFRILDHGRTTHVLNAPSPAATASLAIGQTIAEAVLDKMSLGQLSNV